MEKTESIMKENLNYEAPDIIMDAPWPSLDETLDALLEIYAGE